ETSVQRGASETAGEKLNGKGSPRRTERVDVPAGPVPAPDDELDPVRIKAAAAEDVRRQGGARLHGHRDASLQLVQLDFGGDVSSEDLQIPDETCGREPDVVVESVHLLRSLVGDQGPGGRAAVCREDDAIFTDEAQR